LVVVLLSALAGRTHSAGDCRFTGTYL
jgi:hypothetical protein